uniref:Ig-like domain-containing protein n=1 Tax=Pygocentrus nattereri TaxID=42514 RepID=A0A3B4C5F3_PYGNA
MRLSKSEINLSIEPLENQTQVHAREDETVTLSCQYEGSVNNLLWYRQYPGSRPEYLLLKYPGSTDVTRADPTFLRLDATDDNTDTKKLWNLSISSAAVSDSALYYCAMTPTRTGNSATLPALVRRGSCYYTQQAFLSSPLFIFLFEFRRTLAV